MILPEPHPDKKNDRRLKKKHRGARLFFWLLTVLVGACGGYVLREYEFQHGDRDATIAAIREKISTLPQRFRRDSTSAESSTSSQNSAVNSVASAVANPTVTTVKSDPQAAAKFTQIGDAFYSRARNLSAQNSASGNRRVITEQLIEELQMALENYETAQKYRTDDQSLRDKISTTKQAIAKLTRSQN